MIDKFKSKDYYWEMISKKSKTPSCQQKWCESFPELKDVDKEVWDRIYRLPFRITRETKLQSFQYRLINRIIPCNKWLYNIRIKDNANCNYCECEDNLQHFFLFCNKAKEFWSIWFNWWKYVTGIDLSNCDVLTECILFGYPGTDDMIDVLNYCTLHAKYYIYIQKLMCDNNIDFCNYLVLLKRKLSEEKFICKQNDTTHNFVKFNLIFDSL